MKNAAGSEHWKAMTRTRIVLLDFERVMRRVPVVEAILRAGALQTGPMRNHGGRCLNGWRVMRTD
ncbi:hypothetical protein BBOMB_1504 [Bifidobacterium bombi DSM 19703]|uniref:Uncharacterized protein n=1 Tax=Bifidobacterium bombi DSM 19703 TaxID=1341695 RepID=A0A086BNX4_9BIFI|nr:hypothetical protein BBOMB_1504 [Bifidobacterium bombi DSM 19703]